MSQRFFQESIIEKQMFLFNMTRKEEVNWTSKDAAYKSCHVSALLPGGPDGPLCPLIPVPACPRSPFSPGKPLLNREPTFTLHQFICIFVFLPHDQLPPATEKQKASRRKKNIHLFLLDFQANRGFQGNLSVLVVQALRGFLGHLGVQEDQGGRESCCGTRREPG